MKISATLSKRQSEIAEYIATGWTDKEIADKLFISTRTVNNTRTSIFQATEVNNAAELSAWYFITHYHISIDLLPKTMRKISMIMLLILLPSQFAQATDMRVMRTRVRTSQSRASRSSSKRNNEAEFNFIFN